MAYVPRLKQKYKERVIAAPEEKFSYESVMQIPKLEKIVAGRSVGSAVVDKKQIDYVIDELTKITGQKATATYSRKDVASSKLCKGMVIGAKMTLRGERMYEFLDHLIATALPRVRDFQGIKATNFDGRGNYNLGITEQITFPETDIDKISRIVRMDITFAISAYTDEEAESSLSELGLPFKKN